METSEDLVSSVRLPRIATKPNGAAAVSSSSSSSPSTNLGGQTAAASAEAQEEPVSPCSRLFCQPRMNCYIMCTLGFKNPINLPEFRKTVDETLAKHKRFQSVTKKNAKGIDVWVPTEIDIEAHVFEPSGFSKEDMAAPHFVQNYVADLATASSMNFSRPLWECHVLNGTTSGDAAAHMVLRMHHSLGDGTSLMALLLASTRRVDHPDMLPSIPAIKQKKQKAIGPYTFLHALWKSLILAWNTTIGVAYFFATVLWLKDSDTMIKGHAGEGMAQKSLMFASININDMRLVKEALHGTINDVLMGIIGAGLHRYLESHYNDLENPAGVKPESRGEKSSKFEDVTQTSHGNMQNGVVNHRKNTSKLDRLRVRATVLMNIRKSPSIQELASIMDGGSQSQWGNQIGSLIFPIPLKNFSDPLDRIRAAKKTSNRMKASLEGIFTYSSGAFLMSITGPNLPTRITEHITLQTTLAVSNVAGPMEPVMFGGNPIVHIYAITAGQPQSLSIFFQSYAGKASLVALTSRDLIPDPDMLCHYMVDALQEMKKAVVSIRQDSK